MIDESARDAQEPSAEEDQQGQLSPEALLEVLSEQADGAALFPGSLREQYFFAYDLLLDQGLIARHIKGLRPAKIARVLNHRLIWPYYFPPANSALPTLERTNQREDHVWGLLYRATEKDFTKLERYLMVPNRYHRHAVTAMDRGGRRFQAFTYVLTTRDLTPQLPSASYIERLVEAARSRRLPEEWVEQLQAVEVAD